jgi:hypothetical protein
MERKMTQFDFNPGDRIKTDDIYGVPGIVVDDDDTPPGYIAVVLRDDVCSGVWYVKPEVLELVAKVEDED